VRAVRQLGKVELTAPFENCRQAKKPLSTRPHERKTPKAGDKRQREKDPQHTPERSKKRNGHEGKKQKHLLKLPPAKERSESKTQGAVVREERRRKETHLRRERRKNTHVKGLPEKRIWADNKRRQESHKDKMMQGR